MRVLCGRLLEFLKFRRNSLCSFDRFHVSYRGIAISDGKSDRRWRDCEPPPVSSGRGLLVLSSLGLAGFAVALIKSIIREVECDEDAKKVKNNENIKPTDYFLIDVCFKEAIKKSRAVLERVRRENNCPSITITVSVDGKELWSEGIGLSDVENDIKCTTKSVFRIASISKSVTMAVVGKLVEDGLLDLDLPVQYYVPEWPDKFYNGMKVDITTRQIVSMLSGIRNYDKSYLSRPLGRKKKENMEMIRRRDFDLEEFQINRPFTVLESLNLFKNDDLHSMPGTQYLYSTHGWTLLSAVIEKVTGKRIEDVFLDLFKRLELKDTHLDFNSVIVPNRVRYYSANELGKLQNASPVDTSYKWAAGGLQATSSDVCRFGTMMLAFYQGIGYSPQEAKESAIKSTTSSTDMQTTKYKTPRKPYLNQSTMQMIWTPVEKTKCIWDENGFYGMGWCSVPTRPMLSSRVEPETPIDYGRHQYFSHIGLAMGASSVLLVMPRITIESSIVNKNMDATAVDKSKQLPKMPKGTVVAIMTNMQEVQLNASALEIASIFETAREYHVKNRHNFFQYFMDEDKNVDPELMLSLFYVHE